MLYFPYKNQDKCIPSDTKDYKAKYSVLTTNKQLKKSELKNKIKT